MERSIAGTITGFILGILVIFLFEAGNVLVGDVSAQQSNRLLVVASLSIIGAIIGGTGDIVAAIKKGRPLEDLKEE